LFGRRPLRRHFGAKAAAPLDGQYRQASADCRNDLKMTVASTTNVRYDAAMFAIALDNFCLRGGLTRIEAAAVFGTTPKTMREWARGLRRPHPRAAKRVADVLGIDPVSIWGASR